MSGEIAERPPKPAVLRQRRYHLALLAILLLAGLLRTLWLSQNGFGRIYYAAGVRSMLESWHNFFFNAFDPAAFVSLDKPPVALWLQVASAKLIGFSPFAVMLPQVVAGLAAIVLVYVLVRRSFGEPAGLLAALFLALTPISVAVDRSNNTDSCLVLVLLLAAWALTKAAESHRAGFLMLSMALVGVGFNVKMGAALILVPALAATYFITARSVSPARRIANLAASGVLLVAVSLSWMTIYDLVPSGSRPYAGSTKGNSMLELALVHNGFARFTGHSDAHLGPADPDDQGVDKTGADTQVERPRLWDESPVGLARLFRAHQAAQAGWLLPLALAGLVIGTLSWRRRALEPGQRTSLLLWGGWLVAYWAVFSFAGGVFHTYYLVVLAPPLSALAAIGLAQLWARYRMGGPDLLLLPAALAMTALWQTYVGAPLVGHLHTRWDAWFYVAAIAASLAAGALLLVTVSPRTGSRGVLAAAIASLLALPAAWSLSVVLSRPNVAAPFADLHALAHTPVQAAEAAARSSRAEHSRAKLIAFLRAQHGKERYVVAVPNATLAAPIIAATGMPVMSMGGYIGTDPILTPGDLQRLAGRGELRFVMIGGFSLARPGNPYQQALAQWVRANGTLVDPALWRIRSRATADAGAPRRIALGGGYVTVTPPELYDIGSKPGP